MATGDGPIARVARGEIPSTFDALLRASTFGPSALDQKREGVLVMTYGTIVSESLEASTFTPQQIVLAGKKLALDMIPAGIDFWAARPLTRTATGTGESKVFESRLDALVAAGKRLAEEVASIEVEVIDETPPFQIGRPGVQPTGDFVTPDPYLYPPQVPVGICAAPPWWGK